VLTLLIGLAIGGFIIGGLARLAVPGPDPMPWWLTIGIGLGGSLFGGLAAQLVLGRPGSFLFGYAAAIGLVILYRRFVQGRMVFGPEARKPPTRGWGLKRR
jgi:uncharacterized membrane protein YeaQ/YmgE (transglycosylase-associated protein family)